MVSVEVDSFFHLVLLGNQGVGKTSLIGAYASNIRRTNQYGFPFSNLEIVNGRRVALHSFDEFQIRDLAKGAILVFDVTSRASFHGIHNWVPKAGRLPKLLIGNKADLNGERVVTKEEAEEFARSENLQYFETSASDIGCIRAIFRRMAEMIVAGTVVHEAVSRGSVASVEEVFNLLGGQSIDIDTPDNQALTPMHYAAEFGQVAVIEALVRLGSKAIDVPDAFGRTPLYLAAMKGRAEAVKTLVQLGAVLDNDACLPLSAAASNGHVGVIELLVQLGSQAIDAPDPKNIRTPLFEAASRGQSHAIRALVRLGCQTVDTRDDRGLTPLHEAAENGHEDTVEALVQVGSKALDAPIFSRRSRQEVPGHTPMLSAVRNGHCRVIETLVRLGSRAMDTPNEYGRTPMYVAAQYARASAIETLVRLGSNAIDTPAIDHHHNCQTPLFVACQYPSPCVKLLLALGADETICLARMSERERKVLDAMKPDLEEVLDVRYRVFFSESLACRLLFVCKAMEHKT